MPFKNLPNPLATCALHFLNSIPRAAQLSFIFAAPVCNTFTLRALNYKVLPTNVMLTWICNIRIEHTPSLSKYKILWASTLRVLCVCVCVCVFFERWRVCMADRSSQIVGSRQQRNKRWILIRECVVLGCRNREIQENRKHRLQNNTNYQTHNNTKFIIRQFIQNNR